ncbi:nucleolar protein 8 isoform X1 [Dipodomys merriami]|uniref:nucleolar protein 8 isoform X1 n=2 Tax=Dipodomys merriami TaxID=94247 RepID=UPI0038556977
MKANRETKRLHVGGLSQAISETDLQNQFSRFGEVSDVEIISRKDEQGNSQKVFAYVNITIAEAELKKCMSVLNKTKWKGGTLQIQLAKESFLHRLAQEREEAKIRKEKSKTSNSNFFEEIGGMNFHMKAVPGTEVPGHKNWVVSKFGRVLPVLHLKNQHKHKIMKYDPSKYCHNLKKIAEDFTSTIPISSLTWELEGGNDPMSKKRRGEFSEFHGPPQKMIKVQKGEDCTSSKGSATIRRTSWATDNTATQQKATQKIACDPVTPKSLSVHDASQKPQSVHFQTSGLQSSQKKTSMSDDDIDSEDELRMMIEEEKNLQRVTCSSVNESENDPFEIVRDDFKSDVHKTNLGITNDACHVSENTSRNDCECDSDDTDEIIAMKKNTGKIKNSEEFSKTETSVRKKTSFKKKELSDRCIKVQKRKKKESVLSHGVKPNHNPLSNSSSSSSDEESEGDEEYKAMMENCSRINLTLADLKQLAGIDQKIPEKDTESDGAETTNHCKSDIAPKNPKTPHNLYRRRQCISPEEIVASLLEEENTYGNQKTKENNFKPKFQAFKGVGFLYEKESVKKKLKKTVHEDPSSLKHEHPNSISMENKGPYTNDPSCTQTACHSAEKLNGPNHIQPQNRELTLESKDHKVLSSNGFQDGSKISCLLPLKSKKSLTATVKTHKICFDKDTCHSTKNQEKASEEEGSNSSSLTSLVKLSKISPSKDKKSTADFSLSISNSSDVNTKDKHAEDNQKRLAALEARQKAKEVQKKLVHNALANLDGHPEKKSTHIIFGSDDESETDETSTQEQNHPGEKLMKESMGNTTGKLFDSSDNDESDSEDDSDRFKIKPQFEGRAGQKLMNLQSHFGGDDRFRMDSRFLESDSEEEQEEVNEKRSAEEDELAAEKKKALNVVQSVLHTSLNNPLNKGPAAKKFKDVIHYDPTRHDHATYERKTDDKPKDSKAKRKKKREEAEKLPEVSKEMYYDIAMDLKEIFQTPKDSNEKEEDIPQKEDCAGEIEGSHNSAAQTSGDTQPSGFTFSFFDSHTKDENEETYKVEALKPGKTVWQADPRFQDSSSEEEDVTEEIDNEKPNPGEEILPENETTRFFFFSKNDKRLHGSDLFWRGVGNNMSKNAWEARTNSLLMDCRKKHKEAKRKAKPK